MTKTICTCLSFQSVSLYQLQLHSQPEYTIYTYVEDLQYFTVYYDLYNNILKCFKYLIQQCKYIATYTVTFLYTTHLPVPSSIP